MRFSDFTSEKKTQNDEKPRTLFGDKFYVHIFRSLLIILCDDEHGSLKPTCIFNKTLLNLMTSPSNYLIGRSVRGN